MGVKIKFKKYLKGRITLLFGHQVAGRISGGRAGRKFETPALKERTTLLMLNIILGTELLEMFLCVNYILLTVMLLKNEIQLLRDTNF